MIGISFGGTEYRGEDPQQCAVCGASLSRPWVIRDYDTGRKYYFCENHYMRWNRRRDAALLGVAEEFRATLAERNDGMSAYAEEDAARKRNEAKMGGYENPENGCPNCGRYRVMLGDDGRHRCEKCAWCVEDNDYDSELMEWLR